MTNYEEVRKTVNDAIGLLDKIMVANNRAAAKKDSELVKLVSIKFSDCDASGDGITEITVSFDYISDTTDDVCEAELEFYSCEVLLSPEFLAGLLYGKIMDEEGIL